MSACFENMIDEDIELSLSTTKREIIVKNLREKGLLGYGVVITPDMAESIIEKSQSKLTAEKWQFLLLQLREIIKDEGFYVTSRGRDGNLYILLPHEMPLYNDRKTKTMFKNLKQRQRALHMINPASLNEEISKKLEFEILKNARIELEVAHATKQRCR